MLRAPFCLPRAAAFVGDVQEEGPGQGAGAGEGAQVPLQGRRDHAAAAMPRRPLLPHGKRARPMPPCMSFPMNSGASLSLFCFRNYVPSMPCSVVVPEHKVCVHPFV